MKTAERTRIAFQRGMPGRVSVHCWLGLPLILAAQAQYHGFYHQASHNTHLLKDGIKREPFKDMNPDLLASEAWAVFQPAREARLTQLRETFGAGKARKGQHRDKVQDQRDPGHRR